MGQLHDLDHFFSIGMRILAARFRAIVVDLAHVIIHKKRTRRRFENIIAVFVNTQILFNELARLQTQTFREPVNIILIEYRTGRFAAICAGQAIDFLKHVLMGGMKSVVNFPAVLLFQASQEFLVLRAFFQ